MPTREEVAYFGAGPAPLPTTILQPVPKLFFNFENSSLSLATFDQVNKVLEDTKAAFISLLGIPDNYEIIFIRSLYGWIEEEGQRRKTFAEDEAAILESSEGVREELRVDCLVSGSQSLRLPQEAADPLEPLGNDFVNVALDARVSNGGGFGNIPEEHSSKLSPIRDEGGKGSAFVYYCDNETVDGVEFPGYPKILESSAGSSSYERLIVAEMSFNFLSRLVNVSKYAVIIGGAQKTLASQM